MKRPRKIQILTLGNSKVGKTSILKRYDDDKMPLAYLTTLGVDLITKRLKFDNEDITLKIWDTAGQERFRTITHSFYKQAEGVLLVYDVTDRESFESLTGWVKTIQEHSDADIIKYLVANKIDLVEGRKVDKEEGKAIADKYKMKYYETSARNNINVKEVVEDLAHEIYATFNPREIHARITTGKTKSSGHSGCCVII